MCGINSPILVKTMCKILQSRPAFWNASTGIYCSEVWPRTCIDLSELSTCQQEGALHAPASWNVFGVVSLLAQCRSLCGSRHCPVHNRCKREPSYKPGICYVYPASRRIDRRFVDRYKRGQYLRDRKSTRLNSSHANIS